MPFTTRGEKKRVSFLRSVCGKRKGEGKRKTFPPKKEEKMERKSAVIFWAMDSLPLFLAPSPPFLYLFDSGGVGVGGGVGWPKKGASAEYKFSAPVFIPGRGVKQSASFRSKFLSIRRYFQSRFGRAIEASLWSTPKTEK